MTVAPEAVAEKKKATPRSYTVLRHVDGKTWEMARTVEALSADIAVRKAAEILIAAGEEDSLTLVAVARFQPVTVSVETKTQIKLS